ncbi:MAG: gluconate 2-dehydrogenase alpha chain, partial [Betaproteobacteria bacterium]
MLLGVGMVGAILGRELTRAGLKVVGLERGAPRFTVPDFQGPQMHDELRYSVRKALMQDTAKETFTFRNAGNDTALPIRRLASFLPGTGLGGSLVHWNGQTYRFQDSDFRLRSRTIERYGKRFIPEDVTIQDWGVTGAELEPYFDRFEYLMGTSGKAGNIKGKKIPGGNPFEDPRSREYPTPPQKEPYGSAMFRKAAESLGYHAFPQPSCNLSQPYTNPEGVTLNTCTFCGFCERFGCEHFAKSTAQTVLLPVLLKDPNFELRTGCQVLRINVDSTQKMATGVTYADASGQEIEQPAKLVIVGLFALNNVRMLLLSGIGTPYDLASGKGVVGRNYAYQTTSSVQVFYDDSVNINPFMRSGANGTLIADFVSDNFDHGPLGFIGGAYVGEVMTHGRPIEFHPTAPGTPSWGSAWKKAVAQHYNHTSVLSIHGSSISTRQNYLDLDPTYKDAWNQPLLRMTFDFPENDIKLSAHITSKALEIGKLMGGQQVVGSARKGPYNITQYQTTHNTGGTVMGTDPSTSVVNRYLQSWDVSNVFVIGASNYPQNASYNPTGTLGALCY